MNEAGRLDSLILGETGSAGIVGRLARIGVLAALAAMTFRFLLTTPSGNEAGESFLHLINLPFHEAGHVFFSFFGQFIQSLGGTLMQLLIPLVVAIYFLNWSRDPLGAAVGMWWFGQNLVDIAPYINDARAGKLMLLGGNRGWEAPYGFHDWLYILNESGLLAYDTKLAMASHVIGILVMCLATIWAGALIYLNFSARQNSSLK